jgi:hypothetical protein
MVPKEIDDLIQEREKFLDRIKKADRVAAAEDRDERELMEKKRPYS